MGYLSYHATIINDIDGWRIFSDVSTKTIQIVFIFLPQTAFTFLTKLKFCYYYLNFASVCVRRVWIYQRGNQEIEEGQTTSWPKEKW